MSKVLNYRSTTNFNPKLELEITETKEDRYVTFLFESFDSKETATNFSLWWEDVQGWQYMARAEVIDRPDGKFSVECRRKLSSD